MTDITIPPEALEAGKDAAFSWLRSYMEDDVRVRETTDEELTELVGAVCLAMLKAWPGSYSLAENDSAVIRDVAAIVLPLPQETSE